jgi:ATP-dependent DNA helicase RecG
LLNKLADTTSDFLPTKTKDQHRLMDWSQAIQAIHFPKNNSQAQKARQRLAFEEMLMVHLKSYWRKKDWQTKKLAHQLKIDGEKILEFLESLPFELTKAQKRCLKEILADLKQTRPMNRLLEGDVGSGKTVVAAAAIYAAFLNGVQSALMVPTEILANQHFQTLDQILKPLGVKIALLTGRSRKKAADFDLVIGTHALIHKRVEFKKLGLAIIDEQHRFGVAQRGELIKRGTAPHILTMTATPIPRTIALTLYGDLDLSVLDQMPPGRQIVKTWVVPSVKRQAAYRWIRKQVKDTDYQAFIICPLIEESQHESLASVKAVNTEFKKLQKEIFPDLKLGLLHGRLKSQEKNQVLDKLKANEIDILVSTPVVEVGIDVPTATIMMIEAAERFGLAQLHQLRGRVGRSEAQSYCLLFPELRGKKIYQRLKAMEKNHLGIKLAEIDLKMRGPGEVYGVSQHGFFNLKVASFTDLTLIEKTKKEAQSLTKADSRLKKHPLLRLRLKQATIETVKPN